MWREGIETLGNLKDDPIEGKNLSEDQWEVQEMSDNHLHRRIAYVRVLPSFIHPVLKHRGMEVIGNRRL